jgi:hypothetical protein
VDFGLPSSPAPADHDVGLVDVITRLPCDLVRLFQRLYESPFVSPIAVGTFGRAVDETILEIMSAGRVELDATGSDDDPPAPQQQPCSNGGAYWRFAQTVDDLTRVIEHIAHSRPVADELPGGSTVPRRRTWPDAVRPLSQGAARPHELPTRQINRRRATANRR